MTAPHLERLNPEQYRAVTTLEGPLLVLAGAGSGKTRVLTRRVAHLLHEGVRPENVLAVTFTNKAAAEMKERIVELVGEVGARVWVSTFHSTCARILRQDIEPLGWTRRFAIYDDDDQLRVLREIVREFGYDEEKNQARDILGRIDHYKNRQVGPDHLLKEHRAHGHEAWLRVWREYDRRLLASDALDFNDLINVSVRLFSEHPDVLEKWRDRFRYVMVDEYQDTNGAQYRLLRMLAPGREANLGVVGDDDQSIYGFRGADVTNILNFEKDYPGAAVIRLEQNYRSTRNILAVANKVVAANPGRLDKKLWTSSSPGRLVALRADADPEAEARRVVAAISGLRTADGYKPGDFAIIYRTNAMARVFEAALRQASIPHRIVGGRSLYDSREVRDALGFLRLLVNPADDAALLRIVNVPPRGIGTKTLEKLRAEASTRGSPLLQAARALGTGQGREAQALAAFVALVDRLLDVVRRAAPEEVLGEMLEASGYIEWLQSEHKTEAEERLANLAQLGRDAAAYATDTQHPLDRLRAWLDSIALASQQDELTGDDAVTLMTVHCAKGLEFPVVFVVHMMDGFFPHARSVDEGTVEEERRLAYVAFTRAREVLVVTRSERPPSWPGARREEGARDTRVAPSTFLFGLPRENCEGAFPELAAAAAPPAGSKPVAAAKLGVFVQHRAPAPRSTPPEPEVPEAARREGLPEPDGAYALVDVEDPEQLRPGVLLRLGDGRFARVRNRRGHQLLVETGSSKPDWISLAGADLQIVVE